MRWNRKATTSVKLTQYTGSDVVKPWMLHARVKAKVIHWAFTFRQGRVMSTLYDHIKILILHLWRSEMLNMPETVWTCDFTTSYSAHFKNACRREPKRPQTLVGQQRWRSLILLTAKLRGSSILIRPQVERFPGQAQIRPWLSHLACRALLQRRMNISLDLSGLRTILIQCVLLWLHAAHA